MTYKDLLKRDHPTKVNSKFDGGCSGCPHEYKYCLPEDCMCHKTKFKNFNKNTTCTQCWLQEVPGTETKNTKRLPPDNKKEFKATYVQFSDYSSHREKVIYSTKYDDHFIHFATESGVYVWNDERDTLYSGLILKAKFCKCHTYRDELGNLRTQYLDAPDIHHIEFEEVEVK